MKCISFALFVFVKNPSVILRQHGTRVKEYLISSSKWADNINAKSLCSLYCITLPCEVVSFSALFVNSIVFSFSFLIGSNKSSFESQVMNLSWINFSFSIFPNLSALKIFSSISGGTRDQMKGCPADSCWVPQRVSWNSLLLKALSAEPFYFSLLLIFVLQDGFHL